MITPTAQGLHLPGVRAEFKDALSAAEGVALYQEVCTRISSIHAEEDFRWLGSVPQLREYGASRQVKGVWDEKYTIEAAEYESTIGIDRKYLEDDSTGQIRSRVRELAERAASHKDYLIGQLLLNGHQAGYNSYDGVSFFSAAHERGASGAQSNLMTPAAANSDAPTVPEIKSSIANAVSRMMGFKDDQGQRLRIAPNGFVVVCAPRHLFTFSEALSAEVIASTTNVIKNLAKVAALADLEDEPASWYLLKANTPVRPFIFLDRVPLQFEEHGEGSEHTFMKNAVLVGVRARYKIAYGMWQYAIKSTFTES